MSRRDAWYRSGENAPILFICTSLHVSQFTVQFNLFQINLSFRCKSDSFQIEFLIFCKSRDFSIKVCIFQCLELLERSIKRPYQIYAENTQFSEWISNEILGAQRELQTEGMVAS